MDIIARMPGSMWISKAKEATTQAAAATLLITETQLTALILDRAIEFAGYTAHRQDDRPLVRKLRWAVHLC